MQKRPCAGHTQPHHGRAPAEPGLGDAELAPANDYAMVHHAGSVAFTGRQDQEATEVRVGGNQGHGRPTPMANGVHEAKEFETTRCPQ